MSHLGQRLSALIDGELGDSERDRVLAHLAGCDSCRGEAVALRMLKRRMHSLGETMADAGLTRRLMAGPAEFSPWGAQAAWQPGHGHPPVRYLAVGIFAALMVGLGTTAFMVGGEQESPGPKVTPAVDVYMVQHAIVTGDVPVTPSGTGVPSPVSAVHQGP
jgi:anti-sigma factor RsiW